jgi:DNA-binding winged helix-turn-helix (wHTH) protein/tetratricopeptide (TPR) repeat protein
MESKLLFEFGPFRLDSKKCILWANGNVVHVEPKAAKTLLALVRAKGRPVDKNELIAEVWEGVAVTDSSLTRNISLLRSMLDEFLPGEECIKTIPKIGYRFALEISEIAGENSDHSLRDAVREKALNDRDGGGTAACDTAVSSSVMDLLGSGNQPTAEAQAQPASPRRFIGRRVAAMTFALLMLTMLTLSFLGRFRHETPRVTRMPARPASKILAVYGFKNLSRRPDKDWLATALAEMLSTELGVDKSVDVLAPEQVARARSDLSLLPNDDLTLESLQKVRKMLNVDLVVLGLYTVSGADRAEKLRLDIRVQNAVTGETVATMKIVGWEDDLLTLVDEAGRTLRRDLSLRAVSTEDALTTRASFPANRKAAEFYSEGLARLRLFDAFAARRLLEKAATVEPRHPLIHVALARALSDLGYELAARREGARAVALDQDLPMEERLSVEGQYRQTTKEWAKAIAAYRSLFEYAPEKLEYGLRLADVQIDGGYGKDALATIGGLRSSSVDAQNPRLDLAEARAQQALSNLKAIQLAADNAVANGSARGERLLVADSLLLQAYSSYRLGYVDKAVWATEQAEDLYRLLGNEAGIAKSLVMRANALRDTGAVVRRKKMYEEAIAVFKRIGNMGSRARALNALAGVYQDLGDPTQARRKYQEALGIRREIDDRTGIATTTMNIGTVFENLGEYASAKKMYEDALSTAREIGDYGDAGFCTDNIAGILQKQGRLGEARTKFDEALSIYQHLGLKANVAEALVEIGDIDFAEGNLLSASKQFKQAFSTVSQTDNKLVRSNTLRGLAKVAFAQGNFGEAESRYKEAVTLVDEIGAHYPDARLEMARVYIWKSLYEEAERESSGALQEYERQKNIDGVVRANEILARALLGNRNSAAAMKVIESARQESGHLKDPTLYLAVRIAEARIAAEAHPGLAPTSKRTLIAAIAEAKKNRYQVLAFEAQLALLEVEMRAGEVGDARQVGEQLTKEAFALGFVSIANRAQQLIDSDRRRG